MNDTRRHVAIFLPSLRTGGAKRMMVHVANYLSDNNYNIDIVLCDNAGGFIKDVSSDVRIIDLNVSVSLSLPKLLQYLYTHSPDVLLSTIHGPNVIAMLATNLSRSNTKFIIREATSLSNQIKEFDSLTENAIPYLVKNTYHFADHVIAISEGVKEEVVQTTKVPQNKVEVIYNPTVPRNIDTLADTSTDHPWLKSGDIKVVLGVGRLEEQKDFATLIRAFSLLRRHEDVRLMILGEGSERQKLEKLVKKFGLEQQISLPGFVDNPYLYMNNSDVFVLSSAWEGFGNVLVEAMACGTPVVATNCDSGPAEILEYGEYGPLSPVKNAPILAANIRHALANPIDKSKLTQRSNDFTIKNVQIYQDLIENVIRE